MHRDGWNIHCVAEDCRTVISPYRQVATIESLLKLLRYAGATEADLDGVQQCIRCWSRGSVFITLATDRKNLLAIRSPWNRGLL